MVGGGRSDDALDAGRVRPGAPAIHASRAGVGTGSAPGAIIGIEARIWELDKCPRHLTTISLVGHGLIPKSGSHRAEAPLLPMLDELRNGEAESSWRGMVPLHCTMIRSG